MHQVGAVEDRARAHQQGQAANVAVIGHGIDGSREELAPFFPILEVRIEIVQQIAVGGGVFGAEVNDVRTFARGDPARDRHIKVAPPAGQNFAFNAGVLRFERRESCLTEPGHRIFGQAGDVDFEGLILPGLGAGRRVDGGRDGQCHNQDQS